MKKNDILLLCATIAIAAALFALFSALYLGHGDEVLVRVNGKEYARLPLNKDTELLIEGDGGTNLLVIKDGKAYISEASCPDLICVKTGCADELKSIVCAPNKVSVSIETN